jgi:hypothetical protein
MEENNNNNGQVIDNQVIIKIQEKLIEIEKRVFNNETETKTCSRIDSVGETPEEDSNFCFNKLYKQCHTFGLKIVLFPNYLA